MSLNKFLDSSIIVGSNIDFYQYLKGRTTYGIIDANWYNLYKNYKVLNCLKYKLFLNPRKDFDNYIKIIDFLEVNSAKKNSTIVAIGGGVVGDLTGFAAATYMRGLRYIAIPTTLIAMVDSAIGGKVGLDWKRVRNYIGTFYFPELVLMDLSFVKTLSKEAIISAMGEVIKYSFISEEVFKFLSKQFPPTNYEQLIDLCMQTKFSIVKEDIKDLKKRRYLNLGHTFSHALESLYQISHGVGVGIGIMAAMLISKDEHRITMQRFNVVKNWLLKLNIKKYVDFSQFKFKDIFDYMEKDKKNLKEKINFVLIDGKIKIFRRLDYKYLEDIVSKTISCLN